ncbi:heme-degrading domain-containing protein [Streptomyces sp. RB6PN25]|uniref:UPF0303 protein NGB36_09840 n=1 Tax=Streptomyces humicola TaxID=2953240 RepID=A0ABT1PT89_9ACTN|nr:heme-degrading domain-containing protein [Streptomyces humicola]MCQ4080893.1 heme-degrading domain-containing protein [Streptomyces humicola]
MPADPREQLLAELKAQEDQLWFDAFDNETAWELGVRLVEAARQRNHALTIDVRRGSQQLFHAALPGTSTDNDLWVERKSLAAARFDCSSYRLAVEAEAGGYAFSSKFGADPARYAAAGGSFPVRVRRVGLVGTVTVSGLPDAEDHAFIIDVLRDFLQRSAATR